MCPSCTGCIYSWIVVAEIKSQISLDYILIYTWCNMHFPHLDNVSGYRLHFNAKSKWGLSNYRIMHFMTTSSKDIDITVDKSLLVTVVTAVGRKSCFLSTKEMQPHS